MICRTILIKGEKMEKLVVFYGGKSVEHDISIITGLQVMSVIKNEYELLPIYIDHTGLWWTAENYDDPNIYADFLALAKKPKQVSVEFGLGCVYVFKKFKKSYFKPAAALICLHGANGEDGAIAGVMQMANIPYSCPNLESSAICYDKELTKIVLKNFDIPVVSSITINIDQINKKEIIKKIGFPMIVKPARLGSSVGIVVCKDEHELEQAIECAKLYDFKLIFEHFIENSREFNCAFCLNENMVISSNVYEVVGQKFYSFDEKYLTDKPKTQKVTSKKLEQLIKKLGEKTVLALECEGVVRVDFLMEDQTLFVNEVNTIPGSLAGYLFGNLKEVAIELVENAKARFFKNEQLTFKYQSEALSIFKENCFSNKYAKK